MGEFGIVAGLADQIIPALSALAGVGLTLSGTAWLEARKLRETRQAEREKLLLELLAELLTSVTDTAHVLLTGSTGMEEEFERYLATLNEQNNEALRKATTVRLIAPHSALVFISRIESDLNQAKYEIDSPRDLESAFELSYHLIEARDALIEHLRMQQRQLE